MNFLSRVFRKIAGKADGQNTRSDGTNLCYRDGQLHREDGPAIEYADGTKEWWRDGKFHRDDGAAIEDADGTKYWYRDGNLHRDDGPAIETADGIEYWHLDGHAVTEEVFNARRRSEQASPEPE